jgi:hypothetical protein
VHAVRPASFYIFDPAYAAKFSKNSISAIAAADIANLDTALLFKEFMARFS